MADVEVIDLYVSDTDTAHHNCQPAHSTLTVWSCTACTYHNQSTVQVCAVCTTQRHNTTNDTVQHAAVHDDGADTADSGCNSPIKSHRIEHTDCTSSAASTQSSPSKRSRAVSRAISTATRPRTAKQLQKLAEKEHRLQRRLLNCVARGDLSLLEIQCLFCSTLPHHVIDTIRSTLHAETQAQLQENAKLENDQYQKVMQQCNQQPFACCTVSVDASVLHHTIRLQYVNMDSLSLLQGELRRAACNTISSVSQVLLLLSGQELIDLFDQAAAEKSSMSSCVYNYIQRVSTACNNAPVTLLCTGLYRLITHSAAVRTRIGSCSDVNSMLTDVWCMSGGTYKYRICDTLHDTIEYTTKLVRSFSRTPYKSDLDTGVLTGRTLSMKSNDSNKRVAATYSEQYICYLMQIPGLSEERVTAITQKYPTFHALYTAYQQCGTEVERKVLLSELRVSDRRIGVLSERVGQAIYSQQPHNNVV